MYHVQNEMRKNIQIGIKSKKIDQYVASFVQISSNKLDTLQPSAKISYDNLVSNTFYAQILWFSLIKVLLGEIPCNKYASMPPKKPTKKGFWNL